MNEIDIKDLINLSDGKQYAVCSKASYEDEIYLYLIDINDYQNIKFCKDIIDGDTHRVVELEDPALVEILLPRFFEAAKSVIDEIVGE
jgi:hypothetical protein